VERRATFRWQTPPPTSIDEELALYDDGSAWLVVRRPRAGTPTIGTYSVRPSGEQFAALAAAGGQGVTFDLLGPMDDSAADLMAKADEVADAARQQPLATASFYSPALGPSVDGELSLALQVVGAGERPVQFDIDPLACAVLFSNFGEPVGWREFPDLETGFITPDAEGLGGLGRRAEVPPAGYGAILVKVPVPTPITGVAMQVAGLLYEALPDNVLGQPFEVRTDVFEL